MYLLWYLKARFLKAESKIMPGDRLKKLPHCGFPPAKYKVPGSLTSANWVLGIFENIPSLIDEK